MNRSPVRIWIHGITGHMGQAIVECAQQANHYQLVGGSGLNFHGRWESGQLVPTSDNLDDIMQGVDIIIDFSHTQAVENLLKSYERLTRPPALLLATTGLKDELLQKWRKLAVSKQFALLEAPNTSFGIYLLAQSAVTMAKALAPQGFDIEIMEAHHKLKKDAPSGTAKLLAQLIAGALNYRIVFGRQGLRQQDEVGVVSIRGGAIFGEHQIRFISDAEEIVLEHKAYSRQLFAKGALRLATWLQNQQPGHYVVSHIPMASLI